MCTFNPPTAQSFLTYRGFESRRDRRVVSLSYHTPYEWGVPSQVLRPNNRLHRWKSIFFIYLIANYSKNYIKSLDHIDTHSGPVGKIVASHRHIFGSLVCSASVMLPILGAVYLAFKLHQNWISDELRHAIIIDSDSGKTSETNILLPSCPSR